MNKIKLNMIGGGFQHEICSSAGTVPKYVEWVKDRSADISIHIDEGIKIPIDKTKRNYAWLLESSALISPIIEWVKLNLPHVEDSFELIFTNDKRLLELSDKFKLVIGSAVPWIKNRGVHNKSKLISMIASIKVYCDGHLYRQQIADKYKNEIDLFGRGRNEIKSKEEGLNDYYFSVAILNANYPDYFTDILTDCFATGTIPIFWGTPTIGEYFNANGIISLTNDFKVSDLSPELYYSKMEYILENFERAIEFETGEDYFYQKYIK